jgi:hypothetical protein
LDYFGFFRFSDSVEAGAEVDTDVEADVDVDSLQVDADGQLLQALVVAGAAGNSD